MKVDKLEIKNYRGFKELKINFDENINVFVGINGAGKSSLLDLIATFLNNFTVKLLGVSNRELEYTLTMLDINIQEQETVNVIDISTDIELNFDFGDFSRNDTLSWVLKKDFNGGKSNFTQLNRYILEYQKTFKVYPDQPIPIFKYFQSQRNSTEKQKHINSKKRYIAEQFKAYEDAFDRTLEFDEFVSWFVEEENKENRIKVNNNDLSYKNPKLNAIRKAISMFLKEFPAISYNNLRVEDRIFNLKTSEKSSLVIDKNNQTFNLKQLSDGEKVLILMVADIAHRLALANPKDENCLKGFGVVLIDEIDLHLHPAWQREVIPCLTLTFPNIQFFITSHSPQVLGSVDKDNVFTIQDFRVLKLMGYTKGRDANSILYDVFDVPERSEEYKKEISLLYDYIENEDKENANQQLEKLTKLWGSDDREIVRANMYYEDIID